MNLKRRKFMTGLGSGILMLGANRNTFAHTNGLNGTEYGLIPNSKIDQSKTFQALLDQASNEKRPIFMDAGVYRISNIVLPSFVNIQGIEGETIVEFSGGEFIAYAENGEHVSLQNLSFDGKNIKGAGGKEALLMFEKTKKVILENCIIKNSANTGLVVSESSGQISNNHLHNLNGDAALWALNNKQFQIASNTIENCANNGIVVSRLEQGPDNTIVHNNRVVGMAGKKGGSGQWGNGIVNSFNSVGSCGWNVVHSAVVGMDCIPQRVSLDS